MIRSLRENGGSSPDDPAVVADPADRSHVHAWRITRTVDPYGNLVDYEYVRDTARDGPHHWDQLYLKRIRYVDHTGDADVAYLISVAFDYESRPDTFSDRRAGFEIRTRWRCAGIAIRSHAGADRLIRTYKLAYQDQLVPDAGATPPNAVSLLSQVTVTGHDGDGEESMHRWSSGIPASSPPGARS